VWTWYVTREPDDAAPLLSALHAAGVQAAALPCITRRALPWPASLSPSTETPTWLFCTSAFCASLVVPRFDAWSVATHRRLFVAAVSPTTEAIFSAAGVPVHARATDGAGGLAEAVLAAVSSSGVAPPVRVLYPTSDAGTDAPEQARACERLSRVGVVHREIVYQTRPVAGLAEAWASAAARGPHALCLFSPSAAEAYLDAWAERRALWPVSHHAADGPRAALCVGGSTARAWDARCPADCPPAALVPREDVVATVRGWPSQKEIR
jgi:uroporphyrinogen-III synthase